MLSKSYELFSHRASSEASPLFWITREQKNALIMVYSEIVSALICMGCKEKALLLAKNTPEAHYSMVGSIIETLVASNDMDAALKIIKMFPAEYRPVISVSLIRGKIQSNRLEGIEENLENIPEALLTTLLPKTIISMARNGESARARAIAKKYYTTAKKKAFSEFLIELGCNNIDSAKKKAFSEFLIELGCNNIDSAKNKLTQIEDTHLSIQALCVYIGVLAENGSYTEAEKLANLLPTCVKEIQQELIERNRFKQLNVRDAYILATGITDPLLRVIRLMIVIQNLNQKRKAGRHCMVTVVALSILCFLPMLVKKFAKN